MRPSLVSAVLLLLSLTILFPAPSSAADPGTPASDPALLTVIADDAKQGDGKQTKVGFDMARLNALGTKIIRTTTPWTEGVTEFQGVLVRDVLNAAGISGEEIRVSAVNDYSYTIPVSDLRKYPVILAFKMNGRTLTVRDKGPLWVIYPRDEFPELKTKEIDHRMVWQVTQIFVQ